MTSVVKDKLDPLLGGFGEDGWVMLLTRYWERLIQNNRFTWVLAEGAVRT